MLEGVYVTVPDPVIRLEHLPNRIREGAMLHPAGHFQPHAYREALQRFRREYLRQIVACAEGNVRKAAKLAGLNQSTLYRLGGPRGSSR